MIQASDCWKSSADEYLANQSSCDLDDLVAILGSPRLLNNESGEVKAEPCDPNDTMLPSPQLGNLGPPLPYYTYCSDNGYNPAQCNGERIPMVVKQEPMSYPPYPYDNNYHNHVRPHSLPIASYPDGLAVKHNGTYRQHPYSFHPPCSWSYDNRNSISSAESQHYKSMAYPSHNPMSHQGQLGLQVTKHFCF